MRARELANFIIERERIRLRRAAGIHKPWTKDSILQRYRFCNIHREDDTVTQWIKHNWRLPAYDDLEAWFAMAVARYVNWPDTLERITSAVFDGGGFVRWKPSVFVEVINDIRDAGGKAFTGAYMIRASGWHTGTNKATYLAEHVLGPAWKKRADIRPRKGDSLYQFSCRLGTLYDFGPFMTGQIIADAKHTKWLEEASDHKTFAISGPGSKRGLSRVVTGEPTTSWRSELEWRDNLLAVAHVIAPMLERSSIELDNQDLQNCLCEFDKYERVRLGQGKPRSVYPGI